MHGGQRPEPRAQQEPSEPRPASMPEAKLLMGFALSVCVWQVRRRRYFLYEHPASTSSCVLEEVRAVQCLDGVATATCDACVVGMKAVDTDCEVNPVKQSIRLMRAMHRTYCAA